MQNEYAHEKSSKSSPDAIALGLQVKTSAPFVPAPLSTAARPGIKAAMPEILHGPERPAGSTFGVSKVAVIVK
jgi:hypothetical protein